MRELILQYPLVFLSAAGVLVVIVGMIFGVWRKK